MDKIKIRVTENGFNNIYLGMLKTDIKNNVGSLEKIPHSNKLEDWMLLHAFPGTSLYYENILFNFDNNEKGDEELVELWIKSNENLFLYGKEIHKIHKSDLLVVLSELEYEKHFLDDGSVALKFVKQAKDHYVEFSFDAEGLLELILLSLD